MTPALDAPALEARPRPLIAGELAAIGAITAALPALEEPAYDVLYHTARTSKQANVEQMLALLRVAGGAPSAKGGAVEAFQKTQASVTQRVSETATLRAFRTSEDRLLARYRTTHAALGGFEQRALNRPLARSIKWWHLLTAHIATREGGDAGAREAAHLPRPLSAYLRAEFEVHADLSGLDPEVPAPAAQHATEQRATEQRATDKAIETHPDAKRPAERGGGRLDTAPEAATPSERAYTDALFDPRSVRRSWWRCSGDAVAMQWRCSGDAVAPPQRRPTAGLHE